MGANSNILTMNALCQANRLEGMSPSSEKRLEKTLSNLIENSGPEYVVQVLKVLKAHSVDKLVDPERTQVHVEGDPMISWNKRKDMPARKSGLSAIYDTWPNPRQRIRAIGSMIQSITLEVTSKKQLEKFMTGVTSHHRTPEGDKISFGAGRQRNADLEKLNKRLKARVANQAVDMFSAKHLSASVLPLGTYTIPIADVKRKLKTYTGDPGSTVSDEDAHTALAVLDQAAVGQVNTAPSFSAKYWKFAAKQTLPETAILSGLNAKLRSLKCDGIKSRPYEEFRFPGNNVDSYDEYVGTIGFIQQGGAKLRSVANVNRFVNYTLEPWAKALEDVFYTFPEIRVTDQNSAFEVIQDWIKEGRSLTSLDLTSATDLLDFRALYDPIVEYAHDHGHVLLEETAKYFVRVAESPMYVPDLDGSIRFNTGQPLGAKGSFQTLTVMNFIAGKIAERESGLPTGDLPNFLVVGDDFICDSRMADEYNKVITSWGGKTNIEKSMVSNEYGEFLSHIVTRDTVLKTKPRYRLGYDALYINAEKSTVDRMKHYYRLNKTDQYALELYSLVSGPESFNVPYVKGAMKADRDFRDTIGRAKSILSSFSKVDSGRDQIKTSVETLELAREESLPSVLDLIRGTYGAKATYGAERRSEVAQVRELLQQEDPNGGPVSLRPKREQDKVVRKVADKRKAAAIFRPLGSISTRLQALDEQMRLMHQQAGELLKQSDAQTMSEDDQTPTTTTVVSGHSDDSPKLCDDSSRKGREGLTSLSHALHIARRGVHLDEGEFSTSVDKYDHHEGERIDRDELALRETRDSYRSQARDVAALAGALAGAGDTTLSTMSGDVSAESVLLAAMVADNYTLEELTQVGLFDAIASDSPVDPVSVPTAVDAVKTVIESSHDDQNEPEQRSDSDVSVDETQFSVDTRPQQQL